MEKLFHKINKYSYKLGNSIENNDIQKIDIYTKHHIHHFEQCGKAIIQSGGNMAEFTEMLGEYIDNVNALVELYTEKLQELSSLRQEKKRYEEEYKQIYTNLHELDQLSIDVDAATQEQMKNLFAELESLKELKASKEQRRMMSVIGGSIKNNNKINGAKHDIRYIQQYGKAIIQSGGTIIELKKSLEGYIAAVAQFLENFNIMMQEHDQITADINLSKNKALRARVSLDALSSMNEETDRLKAVMQSEIDALREELRDELKEKERLEVGLKEEEEVLESKKPTIKELIDTMCKADIMDRSKRGECHKSLQQINIALHKKFVKSDKALIFGYNDDDTRKFYKLIKNNNISEFINLLKSDKRVYKGETLLRLIRLENIKSILQGKEVNIKNFKDKTIRIDALDDRFDDVNSLLTNNDDAINEIASFFYDKPIPE